MKKIFLALAAVAALAACSKSEVAYEQTDEISFMPVSKNITKSMIDDNVFPTTAGSFNVWAWFNEVKSGTSPVTWNKQSDKLYITQGEFVPSGTTGIWKGSTSYYWPKVGSLLFAGYYHNRDTDVSYLFDNDNNEMIFSNISHRMVNSSNDNDHSEDLMYFNMTDQSYNSGPVSVIFKHALSWVTVNLKHNGFTTNDSGYPRITIHTVDFTNVSSFGTGTVIGTNGTISWNVEKANLVDSPVTKSDVILTSENQKQSEWLFIPQNLKVDDEDTKMVEPTMTLKLNYTIASSETESFTETMHIPLRGIVGKAPSLTDPSATEAIINTWEPAKHYTYNVVMGLDEILIEPTVTDWATVEANLPI